MPARLTFQSIPSGQLIFTYLNINGNFVCLSLTELKSYCTESLVYRLFHLTVVITAFPKSNAYTLVHQINKHEFLEPAPPCGSLPRVLFFVLIDGLKTSIFGTPFLASVYSTGIACSREVIKLKDMNTPAELCYLYSSPDCFCQTLSFVGEAENRKRGGQEEREEEAGKTQSRMQTYW